MSCSILEAQYDQPVEAISRREYRRRLFAKGRGLEEQEAKGSTKTKERFGSIQRKDALCEAFDEASARDPVVSDVMSKDSVICDDILGCQCQVSSLFDEKNVTRFAEWQPTSEESARKIQVENVMGVEKEEEKELPTLEEKYECDFWLLFGGKEEDELQVENEESAKKMEEEDELMRLKDGEEEEEQGSRRLHVELWMRTPVESKEEEEDTPMTPCLYRHEWNGQWSISCGSFEDTTTVPSMRFTKKPPLDYYSAFPLHTLQIFSIKLAAIRGPGLQLPLDVFGTVSMRDTIDHNRNVIFFRGRDNCQTLTKEDPYLVLTGPTRAVILSVSCPVIVQVELKVKGTAESEDKDLSHLVAPVPRGDTMYSCLLNRYFTTKAQQSQFYTWAIL